MAAVEILGDPFVIVGDSTLVEEEPEIERVVLLNDYKGNCIRATVTMGGQDYKVKVPLHKVIMSFERALEAEGIPVPDTVSGHDTLAGFYDEVGFSFKKLGKKAVGVAKKATRSVAKTATGAVKDVVRGRVPIKPIEKHRQKFLRTKVGKLTSQVYKTGKHGAVQAARSKALGAVLAAGTAVPIVNAVSGPALAAWTIANRADAVAMAAKRAHDAARAGNVTKAGAAILDAAASQSSQVASVRDAARGTGGALVRSALQTIPAGSALARSRDRALAAQQARKVMQSMPRFGV
jgi:hypothetical protein